MNIDFNVPYLSGKESEYIQQVFSKGHFAGNGEFSKRCQRLLEVKYGIPHVLLTTSCTAALEMIALLLDLGPGDEVLMPSYTFVSTASAFQRVGATPVFCEIDPTTMTLDVEDATQRMSERTRAIVPIHYGGIAPDMDALQTLADEHGLIIIEDAAQGLGARYKGSWLGTLAPLAAYSFHETKNIHCGLGGALLINDPDFFTQAEIIWERGTNRSQFFKGLVDKYSWVGLGSSFYPSELQAAFLLAQLESIEENLSERRICWERYWNRLFPLAEAGHFTLPDIPPECEINWHMFFLQANSSVEADSLRDHLNRKGVQAVIHYVPLHVSIMGEKLGYKPADLQVTNEYASRLLRLPFHNSLTSEDIDSICEVIEDFFT